MPPRKSLSNTTFVERHDLWTPAQDRAASAVDRAIKKHKLDLVRFSFVDQHGTLRGKTLVASEAAQRHAQRRHHDHDAARQGHLAPHGVSGVHRGRRPERRRDAGRRRFRHGRRSGDVPRAAVGDEHRLAAVRHRLHQRQAGAVLDPAALPRRAGASSRKAGFDYCAGLEVEFHLFKIENPRLAPEEVAVWPPEPPDVEPHHPGLPVSDRVALRSGRADHGRAARDRRRRSACRCARRRSSSGRASTNSPSRRKSAWRRPTPWCCSAAR